MLATPSHRTSLCGPGLHPICDTLNIPRPITSWSPARRAYNACNPAYNSAYRILTLSEERGRSVLMKNFWCNLADYSLLTGWSKIKLTGLAANQKMRCSACMVI